ncbi:DUF481 domain-containing protein [Litorimonas sp. WD9-15]|uniref:DUF481 domain-containing protein n=1 Tax=Litorimonas sp. WD9-15 TaxID=3418716 RepID=UPI003D0236D7
MKQISKTLIALMATTAMATTAMAQDADGWSGEASLTGSKTTGNTETTDIGLGLQLAKESGVWKHAVNASADFGRASGETNKERYVLGYQVNRDITDRLYALGNADYYRDEFGAFEEGYFLGAGLGYALVQPAPLGWDVEAGLGYRSQLPAVAAGLTAAEIAVLEAAGDLDRQNELALRGASKIAYDFNDAVSLYNNSEVIYSSSDTYLWNELGLTANLVGNLAARASFRVDHHTDVLPGREKTDTITRFGVVYTMN